MAPVPKGTNDLPKWLHKLNKSLHPSPTDVLRCRPTGAMFLPTRVERSLAQRSLTLFGGTRAGNTASPDWLRQMATVSLGGGIMAAAPRPRDGCVEACYWQRQAEPLEAGTLLVAGTPRKKKMQVMHSEMRLIERLRLETPEELERLSPLVLYTVLFPCRSCAETISKFAREYPSVRIELSYEDVWERYVEADRAASFEMLGEAGVAFDSIRDLARMAREAGADARLVPRESERQSRYEKPKRSPEEIAEIRAQRAAKAAALEAAAIEAAGSASASAPAVESEDDVEDDDGFLALEELLENGDISRAEYEELVGGTSLGRVKLG